MRLRRQTVSEFECACELKSIQGAQNVTRYESRCPVYQSVGIGKQKVVFMGVGHVGPKEERQFRGRDFLGPESAI